MSRAAKLQFCCQLDGYRFVVETVGQLPWIPFELTRLPADL